jgi:N,N'-diacetyllegionaminate synthase
MDRVVTSFPVGRRMVGPGAPCFVIAEAGVNHNGSLDAACQLVDVAHAAGADAVKFQTFSPEALVTPSAPKAAYQKQHTAASESQLEMLQALALSVDDHRVLVDRCRERGLIFMSTPFDEGSADFLASLDVPAFKLGSGELTNLPLLAHVARLGKPLFLSTGMATLGEVEAAVATVTGAGATQVVLLQCVSNYPADPRLVNLRAMDTMARAFNVPVGYSDHTLGLAVSLAAVALGACVIEKHFTLDRAMPGPDHQASAEPAELAALVAGVRVVESAMGDGRKVPTSAEADTAAVARRSLVAAVDIAGGAVIADAAITVKRPGTGLPPALRRFVVGRTARVSIPRGTVISLEMLA